MPNRLTLDADAEHAGERQLTRLRRRFLAARKRISPRICRHTIHVWNHSLSRSKCLKRLQFLSFQRKWLRPSRRVSRALLRSERLALVGDGPEGLALADLRRWARNGACGIRRSCTP